MLPAAVAFPMGAIGAAQVSMPVLCAATSAAAFRMQEGDAGGVKEIYEHIGVSPEHYGEATRQMHAAWSVSRWFEKPGDVAYAIRPTEEMVDEVIEKLNEIEVEDGAEFSPKTSSGFYMSEVDNVLAEGRMKAVADYLEYVSEVSLRVGDIEAALAGLEKAWELMQSGQISFHAYAHTRMAEYWAKAGNGERAVEHMNIVLAGLSDQSVPVDDDDVLFASAITFAKVGSSVRAALAASAIEDEVSRFSAYRYMAQEMLNLRQFKMAEAYLSNETFEVVRNAEYRRARITQLRVIVEELMKHGMNDSARKVMDELIDPSRNLDNLRARYDNEFEDLVWAAKAMRILGYSLEWIVNFLTRGWLNEKHPMFAKAPAGRAYRLAQARVIRGRWWGGELNDIADAWQKI